MSEHHTETGASAVVFAIAFAAIGCAAEAGPGRAPVEAADNVDAVPAENTEAAPTEPSDSAAADSDTQNIAPAPATEDTSGRSDATYEVPVAAELMSFATYDVSHVKWEVKKGARVLEYNLPDDLTGASNKVQLSGPDTTDNWELSGAAGDASCKTEAGQIRCHESLPGITVDVGAIELRVSMGQLAQEKLAVTKVFQGDPLGILQFTPR